MNEMIQIFENPEFGRVRTAVINETPYFAGRDVAEILGYSNTRQAILDHVDEEDKTDGVTIRDSIGREQNPVFINESGLYSLILSSKLPSARKFKKWVTADVLPSIRKHGMYAMDDILRDPDLFITALEGLKAERKKNALLEEENLQKKQIIAELQPKATYYDLILQSSSVVPVTTIAKDYGFSGKAFNKKLHELGIQFRQGKTWLLYQKYADKGYTQSKTHVIDADRSVMNTYWTQKGRLFLYDFLKEHGILPLIEQEAA